jgi:hypothetical protein
VTTRCLSALQYDPEGFGEIPWDDFLEVLNSPEFAAEVDANKRDILLQRAQERSTTAITFQDFVNVVSLNPTFPQLCFFARFFASFGFSFFVFRIFFVVSTCFIISFVFPSFCLYNSEEGSCLATSSTAASFAVSDPRPLQSPSYSPIRWVTVAASCASTPCFVKEMCSF